MFVYKSPNIEARGQAENSTAAVTEGTTWAAIARRDVLWTIDAQHSDTDGTSLARESYYFSEIATYAINQLLLDRPVGTYLLRRTSDGKGFAVEPFSLFFENLFV